jgi:copper(I)-binding protein
MSVVAACGAPQQSADQPAAEANAVRLQVHDMWAAVTPGGVDVSAGYMIIANGGGADDRLLSATSPRAAHVEVHEMVMDGAVMRMRPIEGLVVPAGGQAELAPGGQHLMFTGVTQPFVEGEEIPVQLVFEHAGAMDIALPVRAGSGSGGH